MIIVIYIILILTILIVLNLSNNCTTNLALIWLTKLYYNNLFLIVLTLLLTSFFFNANNYVFLFLSVFVLKITLIFNIPLSNVMFSIHPTITYIYLIFSLLSLQLNLRFNFFKKNIFFLNLSMFLGGVWSLQEFNWGGWWNWDLIEMYILLIVYFYIFITHSNKKTINVLVGYFLFWFLLIIYYITSNKLGINVSIHSFIKSKFYSNYYYSTLILLYITLFFWNFKYSVCLTLPLIYANNFVNNLFIFKPLLIILIYCIPNIKKKYSLIIHNIFNGIYLFFFLFNFKNKTYYSSFIIPKNYVFFFFKKNKFILKIKSLVTYYSLIKTKVFWYKLTNLFFKSTIFLSKLGYSGFFFSFFF